MTEVPLKPSTGFNSARLLRVLEIRQTTMNDQTRLAPKEWRGALRRWLSHAMDGHSESDELLALPAIRELIARRRVTYHVGLLAVDRFTDPCLDLTAAIFEQLAEDDIVLLTCRRLPDVPDAFEYYAHDVKFTSKLRGGA